MKEIEKLIRRKTKEMDELKEKFNNTDPENKYTLERLDNKIEKLRYYIMGLEDAKTYIAIEKR